MIDRGLLVLVLIINLFRILLEWLIFINLLFFWFSISKLLAIVLLIKLELVRVKILVILVILRRVGLNKLLEFCVVGELLLVVLVLKLMVVWKMFWGLIFLMKIKLLVMGFLEIFFKLMLFIVVFKVIVWILVWFRVFFVV